MTVMIERDATQTRSLALGITRACQARCAHCYNHSGPSGRTGAMTASDRLSVLDQAAAMGVEQVQFIGGEPTLHPALPALVGHALALGMSVEVCSNLIHVRPALREILERPGVSLAASYYSDRAEEHEQITRHRGSYCFPPLRDPPGEVWEINSRGAGNPLTRRSGEWSSTAFTERSPGLKVLRHRCSIIYRSRAAA